MIPVAPARWVALGAIFTVTGLIAAATAPVAGTVGAERMQTQQSLGGAAALLGWLVLGWGVHKLGRERSG